MRSSGPIARSVPWLLCAVILITRLSGAHVHLCFDGTVPLFSVHAENSRVDLGHEQSSRGHSDLELSLGSDALVKKAVVSGDLPNSLCIALVVLLLAGIAAPKFMRPRTSPVPTSRAFLLRPPLRGPPL